MKGLPRPSEPCPVRVAVFGNKVPRWRGDSFHHSAVSLEAEIITIVTVGIDLAKNILAVHDVDETGKATMVRPEVSRGILLELIGNLPPCLIGMEACSDAHHWARESAKVGHAVRLRADGREFLERFGPLALMNTAQGAMK
jgi:hypothetical protein